MCILKYWDPFIADSGEEEEIDENEYAVQDDSSRRTP